MEPAVATGFAMAAPETEALGPGNQEGQASRQLAPTG